MELSVSEPLEISTSTTGVERTKAVIRDSRRTLIPLKMRATGSPQGWPVVTHGQLSAINLCVSMTANE